MPQLDLEEKEIAVQESAYEAPSIQRKVEMDLDKARSKTRTGKSRLRINYTTGNKQGNAEVYQLQTGSRTGRCYLTN
jgi:hypothetical protein